MKEARLVYYSVAAGRPGHERQFAHSVAALRRHNPTIAVHACIYNDPSEGLLAAARRHRVTVHALGNLGSYLGELSPHGATMARMPTLHKVLSLAHLPAARGDRILYVDCDTHFFADVGLLFDRYQEFDYYAREEPWTSQSGRTDPQHLDEAALERLFHREGLRPVIPFNTGVVLYNHGVWGEVSGARARFVDFSWRLMLGACQVPLKYGPDDPELRTSLREAFAKIGPGGALPYPSGSFWILDEVAHWLTMSELTGLAQGLLSQGDVMQDGEFNDTPPGILAHYFSSCEAAFLAWAGGSSGPARPAEGAPTTARVMDDGWRSWVAENLLLDAAPGEVLRVMAGNGLDAAESAAEVGRAQGSPYIRGAGRLRNRLKKREWLLAVYRKLDRLRPGSGAVERRHRPDRDEFFGQYYCANRPVVIAGMMDDWPALGTWCLDDFASRFGNREVEVQFGHHANGHGVDDGTSARAMPMDEYVAMLRSAGATSDFSLTVTDRSRNQGVLSELWEDVGPVPEYLDGRESQRGSFRLCPAGQPAPFRHDLMNRLVAQVVGSTRVLLVPSWDLPLMDNHHHVFSSLDGRETPPSPGADFGERRVLERVIGAGEMLFLPVGWMYSAEDLEVSATVSFTNFLYDNDFHSFYTTHGDV